jgi:hydroxymethylglutaryl-CoA lyase
MASDQTVGNLPTEKIISYLNSQKSSNNIDLSRFEISLEKSLEIFNEFN